MAAGLGMAPRPGRAGGSYLFLVVCSSVLRELRPFLGKNAEIRVRRARQLTLVPYFTAGILSCAAGALNPVGPLLILVSAAARHLVGIPGWPGCRTCSWSAHSQHAIADARNRTLLGMGDRRRDPGAPIYRGTRTWSEVSFSLASKRKGSSINGKENRRVSQPQ